MLFSRYNLYKNHGDFVHLNMLKWALKYVPEFGKKTVQDTETANTIEIGTGGVDITTINDTTEEEKSKHVPYTDLQVNGVSSPTFNIVGYANKEASKDSVTGTLFDRYTKIISSDSIGETHPDRQEAGLIKGMSFYDKDTVNVDGEGHRYITKVKYLSKDPKTGVLTDSNDDMEFKPYTSVLRDDNTLASKVQIKHDSTKMTGVFFPQTNEEYEIPNYTSVLNDSDHLATTVKFKHQGDKLTGVTLGTGENYNVEVARESLLNMVYPVGSIYLSAGGNSPVTLFGGSWQRLEGKFLLGASDDYPLGTEGGEAQHTLTNEEMPVHTHIEQAANSFTTAAGRSVLVDNGSDNTSSGFKFDLNLHPLAGGWSKGKALETMSAGYGKAHNNLPPYIAVNIWKRLA